MITRLRYIRSFGTSLLVSKEDVICNNKAISVVIDRSTLIYELTNGKDLSIKGQGKTLTECKKNVRMELIKLGANFTKQIRNRGKTKKL